VKISVVTVAYRAENTIAAALESVAGQTWADVEHVVVDGASPDRTLEVIRAHAHDKMVVVSEPDQGIYDALNKGFRLSTGDVVGIVHADDILADDTVLERVAEAFEDPDVDAVYGDLDYVARDNPDKIIRHWEAGAFSQARLRAGWMPPHPTLFLRRRVFETRELFDTSFRIAADYDAILRYFGHPIWAIGAVLTTRLLHSVKRDGPKRGIVTLCVGGGRGIAPALAMLWEIYQLTSPKEATMPDPKFTKPWHGIARQEIHWNPTIVGDVCIGCGTCVTGCSRLVCRFEFERKKPVVFAP